MVKISEQKIELYGKKITKKVKQKVTVLGQRINHTKKLIATQKKAFSNIQELTRYHGTGIEIVNSGMNSLVGNHRDKIDALKKKFPVVSLDAEKFLAKIEDI